MTSRQPIPSPRPNSAPPFPIAGAMLIALISGLVVGCSKEAAPTATAPPPTSEPSVLDPSTEAATLRRGREIVTQAGQSLSGVLLEALRTGGPTNALPLCSVQALPLTASLAQANQVQLRRVSHRPRNPANRANPQELSLIEDYRSALASQQLLQPTLRSNTDGSRTFYAPIVITTNLCLQCHGIPGDTLHPEIAPLLQTLYPADEATGFSLGNIRGLWGVDFPLTPSHQAEP